jgi:uncharacterized membrane protein
MQNRPGPDGVRAKKKAQFTEPKEPKKKATVILILALVAVAAAAAYLLLGSSADKPAATAVQQVADPATPAADIRIPIADLGKRAKFFDYTLSNNKRVRFFAIQSADGVYRAALDACDVCYHSKKGYKQEGDDMICNNCGLKFHSSLINEVSGGCNPISLPRAIEGDHLVIKAGELERREKYF